MFLQKTQKYTFPDFMQIYIITIFVNSQQNYLIIFKKIIDMYNYFLAIKLNIQFFFHIRVEIFYALAM